MANVWDKLANKIGALPEDIKKAYMTASKKAINEEGMNLEKNLDRGSQQAQFIPEFTRFKKIDKDKWEEAKTKLRKNLYAKPIVETPVSYVYEVDWTDKIVDEDLGVNWGKFKNRKRMSGKRNYSKAPATYHDLAYILSEGRVANLSQTGVKVVQGTGFIRKAWRNAKKWRKKQDKYFTEELTKIGTKWGEDK